jgi:RNA polymerase sigma-70 factor (ECF subfamily)
VTIGPAFGEVVRAAGRGDERAAARLYRDVAPLVLGYLRANGVRDAEDVASDVFVSMVRSLPRFSGGERQFQSWLLTIAHRRMVDHVRRSQVRAERPVPVDGIEAGLPPAMAADEAGLGELEAAGLLAAVDALTPDQRAVLLLRALADLTVPEIARVVGKPETAVKALLRRGIARLTRDAGRGPYPSGATGRSSGQWP